MTEPLPRIATVDPVHAETMKSWPTTFAYEALPFYKRFRLLRATVALPSRPLVLEYVDDGALVVPLGGGAKDIDKVNGLEALALEATQIGPYLRFFLAHSDPDAPARVVERPEDVPWLPSTRTEGAPRAARAAAESRLRALEVRPDPRGDFTTSATVLSGSTLRQDVYRVERKGAVRLVSSQTLLENIPVATVADATPTPISTDKAALKQVAAAAQAELKWAPDEVSIFEVETLRRPGCAVYMVGNARRPVPYQRYYAVLGGTVVSQTSENALAKVLDACGAKAPAQWWAEAVTLFHRELGSGLVLADATTNHGATAVIVAAGKKLTPPERGRDGTLHYFLLDPELFAVYEVRARRGPEGVMSLDKSPVK